MKITQSIPSILFTSMYPQIVWRNRGWILVLSAWVFLGSLVGLPSARAQTVTTLAGSVGIPGSADGTGSAAQFYYPYGVTVDGSGNVYVADCVNDTIRKITSGGAVTTMAGYAGYIGSADGTGSAARFYYAYGVAVDGSGNVYVADSGNDTIRKVTPGGVVTTLAGSAGNYGSADGTGSAAQFYNPTGLAVDGSGNVYVADTYNDTIRKVTPSGVVTTLAGYAGYTGSADGTGSAAQFYQPYGVAVDGSGNIYVADSVNDTIRKVTPGGVVTTIAGSARYTGSADGTGSAAQFYFPLGVAVDGSGNVYVADTSNNAIRKVTPGGVVTTIAGSAGYIGSAGGTGSAARFDRPAGVAVDGSGNVYVTDSSNYTIRKITFGVVTPWPDATDLGNGWESSTWFGVFNVNLYPWIYHLQHGWMYVFGTDPGSIWLWTTDMGFLWTGNSVYPFLWRNQDSTWLYYLKDSQNPRWFYNYTTSQWESHNP